MTKIVTSGKRKRAIARAVLSEGNGKVSLNGRALDHLPFFDKLRLEEPVRIAKEVIGKTDFDVAIKVRGGGEKGQLDAARVALSRAIVQFTKSKELEKTYLEYDKNMIIADVRRKETYKPGDSKARAMRQSSKR